MKVYIVEWYNDGSANLKAFTVKKDAEKYVKTIKLDHEIIQDETFHFLGIKVLHFPISKKGIIEALEYQFI